MFGIYSIVLCFCLRICVLFSFPLRLILLRCAVLHLYKDSSYRTDKIEPIYPVNYLWKTGSP